MFILSMYTCTVHLSQRVTKFMCKNSISSVFFKKGIIKMISCLTICFYSSIWSLVSIITTPGSELLYVKWLPSCAGGLNRLK